MEKKKEPSRTQGRTMQEGDRSSFQGTLQSTLALHRVRMDDRMIVLFVLSIVDYKLLCMQGHRGTLRARLIKTRACSFTQTDTEISRGSRDTEQAVELRRLHLQ